MANVMIPGIGKMTGVNDFPTFPAGDYTFEVDSVTVKNEIDQNHMLKFRFDLNIIDCESVSHLGKKYAHFINIPFVGHESFSEDWQSRQQNDLVAMCIACGLKIVGDAIPTHEFKGKTLVGAMAEYTSKKDGKKKNSINAWKPDTGAKAAENADVTSAASGAFGK